MKFFKILKLLILLFLVSCNDSNNKPIEDVNPDSTISLEKNNENEELRVELESKKQVQHLSRIISQNKKKLEEYEIKIKNGDTSDVRGINQYVEDLKKAIKLKEERLSKLKKK